MRSFKAEHIPVPRIMTDLGPALAHSRLDIEIGAGQGMHAVRYAAQNPSRHLIAIERTHNRFRQLARRHQDHPEIKNLTVLHADALSVFTHQIPDQAVDRIFLLYPNPYPKEKQANQRWHNMPFMQLLKQKLKSGGELVLATNIESYALEAERRLVADWRFQLLNMRVLGDGDSPRTHFEKKYLERGQRCWNFTFENGGPL